MDKQNLYEEMIELRRQSYERNKPKSTSYGEEVTVPTRSGAIKCYLHNRAKHNGTVYFNMHGGAFFEGFVGVDDRWCQLLADLSGCMVVNVEYRLAPEFPYPAAVHDCWDAIGYFHGHADRYQADPETFIVGGQSAGGNLATVMCLLAAESGSIRFRGQMLSYPALDLGDPYAKPANEYSIPRELAKKYNASYCQNGEQNEIHVSPIRAGREILGKLPPALILSAEHDSLCDEAEAYGNKLIDAGVEVAMKRFLNARHGFTYRDVPESYEAWKMTANMIRYWIASGGA